MCYNGDGSEFKNHKLNLFKYVYYDLDAIKFCCKFLHYFFNVYESILSLAR